jgi:endoglucanase
MKKLLLLFVLISNYYFAAGPATIVEFIKIDQFGYKPNDQKIAVIANPITGYNNTTPFSPGTTYQVRDWVSNAVVFTGSLTIWNTGTTHTQSGDKIWHFDFSTFTTPGSYYVFDVTNNVGSYRFDINTCVYNDVLKTAVRMFYYQRCGQARAYPFCDTGYVDAKCHQGTQQDQDCRLYNNTNISTSRNLSGGWHDAGDYNKYVNFAYGTLVDLLLAYEENPGVWTDNYNIPESGNGIPDILDEAKYEIDWLVNMMGTDSALFCVIGGGGASPPSADAQVRRYGPKTTAATLTGANIFALAAIQFKAIGQTAYAANLQARAIMAWKWAMDHPNVTFYNSGVLAAGEQQTAVYETDMRRLTGACYLYALTGTTSYKTYFDANVANVHLLLWSYAYPFEGTEQDGILYYTKIPGATASIKTQILNAYTGSMQTNNTDNLPSYTNKTDAYRAYLANNNYTWNSNQTKSKQGIMFQAMNVYTLNTANAINYTNAASGFIHYLHGVNPISKVYLSNMKKVGGDNYVKQFYHGWFKDGSALWDENGLSTYGPAPGFIPGGPNPTYSLDACCPGGCGSAANNALCLTNVNPPQGQPIQKSYKDFNNDWPVNSWEITEAGIYTNAAYVRMLSKFVSSGCITTEVASKSIFVGEGVMLYPNPTDNKLFLKFDNVIMSAKCTIYSISGQQVYSNNFNGINNSLIELNVENLSAGVYFIEINNANGKQVKKFVKE